MGWNHQGGLFLLGLVGHLGIGNWTHVPIDHGGVMVVLLGLETTREPEIADRKKLGGSACSALDDGVQSVLNLQPKT